MFSRLATVLLLAAVLALTGCRVEPGRQAVARVNGSVITVAELVHALPEVVNPNVRDSILKRDHLEDLIDTRLMAAEAERRGLETVIAYHQEIAHKRFLIQELHRHVTAPGREISEATLDTAYRELIPEYKLRIIEVTAESIARRLERELDQGAAFESLAVRWSVLPNAPRGGHLGDWLPRLWLEEPVKDEVLRLSPGEHTPAVRIRDRWQIVKADDRREPDPPPPPLEEISGMLTVRLRQHRQQQLARQYKADIDRRLEYLPEGLAIVVKPVESIAPAELDMPVATLDGSKYVKVGRLMHIIERFPPALDSAMRHYAVEREIREDLMYDEALRLGLEDVPSVQDSLAGYRRRLLRQALLQLAVVDSVTVTEAELRARYEERAGELPGVDFAAVARQIETELVRERRDEARRRLIARLREQADIRIHDRALNAILFGSDGKWQ